MQREGLRGATVPISRAARLSWQAAVVLTSGTPCSEAAGAARRGAVRWQWWSGLTYRRRIARSSGERGFSQDPPQMNSANAPRQRAQRQAPRWRAGSSTGPPGAACTPPAACWCAAASPGSGCTARSQSPTAQGTVLRFRHRPRQTAVSQPRSSIALLRVRTGSRQARAVTAALQSSRRSPAW